jgi:hypothetical protein
MAITHLEREVTIAITSFLSSGRLTNLTSLVVVAPLDGPPPLLTPLGQLASLTQLAFSGRADPASTEWLPRGLRVLLLSGRAQIGCWGIGCASWLNCVAACRGLEQLHLYWLKGADLGEDEDTGSLPGVPELAKFYSRIGQVG